MKLCNAIIISTLMVLGVLNAQAFKDLSKVDQNRFSELIGEGRNALQKQLYFEAITSFEEAKDLAPEEGAAYTLLTSAYVDLRFFSKAAESIEALIKLKGGSYDLLYNLGEILFVGGRYKEALEQFEKALKIAPKPVYYADKRLANLIKFKKLICLEKLGRTKEVEAYVSSVNELEDSPVYLMVQFLKALKDERDPKKSTDIFVKASRLYGQEISLYQDALNESGYDKLQWEIAIEDNNKLIKSL